MFRDRRMLVLFFAILSLSNAALCWFWYLSRGHGGDAATHAVLALIFAVLAWWCWKEE